MGAEPRLREPATTATSISETITRASTDQERRALGPERVRCWLDRPALPAPRALRDRRGCPAPPASLDLLEPTATRYFPEQDCHPPVLVTTATGISIRQPVACTGPRLPAHGRAVALI